MFPSSPKVSTCLSFFCGGSRFSDSAAKALDEAVALAKNLGASVHVVHVYQRPLELLSPYELEVPASLQDKTIAQSGVREQTGCTIVAVRDRRGELQINPPANLRLEAGREMILVGSMDSQTRFLERFVEG